MSSLTESVKFAQLPRKPQSAAMLERCDALKPLIKSIFPDWKIEFIDNPVMDSTESFLRNGDRFIHVVFYNEHFLKPVQERDSYFISFLQMARLSEELKLEV